MYISIPILATNPIPVVMFPERSFQTGQLEWMFSSDLRPVLTVVKDAPLVFTGTPSLLKVPCA